MYVCMPMVRAITHGSVERTLLFFIFLNPNCNITLWDCKKIYVTITTKNLNMCANQTFRKKPKIKKLKT